MFPATGQQIINAVRSISDRFVQEEVGEGAFHIGRASYFYYEEHIIGADESWEIHPDATYNTITVAEHQWPGEENALRYIESSVKRTVTSFALTLQAELQAENPFRQEFSCSNALSYPAAQALVGQLEEAGLSASIMSGGIWVRAFSQDQVNALYGIASDYSVLFYEGNDGLNRQ